MIIAFSGVDCAGKSTQIELLRQFFISQGKSCFVFWYRPGYSPEIQKLKNYIRPLLLLAKNPLHHQISHSSNQPESSCNSINNSKINVPAPIWLTSAIIDTAIQYAIKLRALEKKYDVIICDRYIYDACLDLEFKYPQFSISKNILRTISNIFPKPEKSILLWLSYEQTLQRVEMKNEPFPDPPKIRKLRWRAYQFIADEDDITLIDCSGSIEDTHQKILDTLKT